MLLIWELSEFPYQLRFISFTSRIEGHIQRTPLPYIYNLMIYDLQSIYLSVYLYILTYLTNNIHGFPWIFPPSPQPLLPRFVSRMSAEEDAMVARRALIEILHGMWLGSWRWLVVVYPIPRWDDGPSCHSPIFLESV